MVDRFLETWKKEGLFHVCFSFFVSSLVLAVCLHRTSRFSGLGSNLAGKPKNNQFMGGWHFDGVKMKVNHLFSELGSPSVMVGLRKRSHLHPAAHGSKLRNLGACGWNLSDGELEALQAAAQKAPKTQPHGF